MNCCPRRTTATEAEKVSFVMMRSSKQHPKEGLMLMLMSLLDNEERHESRHTRPHIPATRLQILG